MASDYDGDASGRFMNQRYPLGARMKWFPPDHPDYDTWNTWGDGKDEAKETCYARCPLCHHLLAVVIHFRDVTPVSIGEIAPAEPAPR